MHHQSNTTANTTKSPITNYYKKAHKVPKLDSSSSSSIASHSSHHNLPNFDHVNILRKHSEPDFRGKLKVGNLTNSNKPHQAYAKFKSHSLIASKPKSLIPSYPTQTKSPTLINPKNLIKPQSIQPSHSTNSSNNSFHQVNSVQSTYFNHFSHSKKHHIKTTSFPLHPSNNPTNTATTHHHHTGPPTSPSNPETSPEVPTSPKLKVSDLNDLYDSDQSSHHPTYTSHHNREKVSTTDFIVNNSTCHPNNSTSIGNSPSSVNGTEKNLVASKFSNKSNLTEFSFEHDSIRKSVGLSKTEPHKKKSGCQKSKSLHGSKGYRVVFWIENIFELSKEAND